MREVERLFGAAQLLVDPFERGQIEPVLVAEIMIDHPLVGVRAARDLIDAPARETLGREFVLRGDKDRFARAVGVAPVRTRFRIRHARSARQGAILTGSGRPLLSSQVTTRLPGHSVARRERCANLGPNIGARHEDHRESRARDARACTRRVSGRGAKDHLHAQLGRGRRPRAVFLCPEDGLVQTGRPRRRLRDRPRLRRFGAEGRRRPARSSACPTWRACCCSAARASMPWA